MKNKWFRLLVCLVVAVALIVNISPMRAKAVAGTLTGSAIMYWLYALAAGVVIAPPTIAAANKLGEQLDDAVKVKVQSDFWDTYTTICDNLDNLVPEWDPGDFHNDLKTLLARGLLGAIGTMVVGAVLTGKHEVEGETEAEEGYAYYNGYLFPELYKFASYNTYLAIAKPTNGASVRLYGFGKSSVRYHLSSGKFYSPTSSGIGVQCAYLSSDGTSWMYDGVFTLKANNGGGMSFAVDVIWSNFDLYDSSGALHMAASEYSSIGVETTTITPSVYVGDIPQKIQDGEYDEDTLPLPQIDPSRIVTSPETAFDELTAVSQQLADGTMTYNDYITNITYQAPTDPDPGTDPTPDSTTPSDPADDPDTGTEDDTDLGDYTLQLKDFFPFCIPYDIYEFFALLAAEPEAPVFNWEIFVPQLDKTLTARIDLSPWNEVAALFRKLELLAFIVGLGFVTRDKFIRG